MKQRLLSIFVAMCLLLSTMSAMIITVNAQEYGLDVNKMVTGDTSLATLESDNAEIGGRSGVLEFNTAVKQGVRYQGIGLSASMAANVRYLLVDVYYKKNSNTAVPFRVNATFRQVNNKDGWGLYNYNGGALRTAAPSNFQTMPNRWETIAIDCQAQMDYLTANKSSLWGLQLELPTTSGEERIYIGDVRFSDSTSGFEFSKRATIVTGSDLSSGPETVDYQGKTGVQKFNITSGKHTIRYNDLRMGYPYSASNRYLLVEGYLEDENLTEYSLTVGFRSTYGNDVNTDNWNTINQQTFKTQTSESYKTNKWVTIAIDCQQVLQYLATGKYDLKQMQIVLPATTGNFYMNSIRFASGIQSVYTDALGNKYVYLSEDGVVTVGEEDLAAFTTTQDAFAALGTDGGTIYLEGELNAFQDVAKDTRGAVLLRGLGDDVTLNVLKGIENIEVKGGDLTLDYLTVEPFVGAESEADYTSIFTCQTNALTKEITIGEHISSTGLALGIRKGDNALHYAQADKITVNSGYFHAITPMSSYNIIQIARLGTTEYTINGGRINTLFAGSNNSWEWAGSKADSGIRGDVKYTINGGEFTGDLVMGSSYGSTKILGNIIWTVNDGDMTDKRIIGGDQNAAKKPEYQTELNNVAAIVNLKGEKEGLSTLILGTDNAKGRDISGKEIYILNNYEDNKGTKIADGSLAEYKIHVYHGQAEPVFANDKEVTINGKTENYGGDLLGFRLTADEEGDIPYINGVAASTNEQGLYVIPEDTSNVIIIAFSSEDELVNFTTTGNSVKAEIFGSFDATIFIAKYKLNDDKKKLIDVSVNSYSAEQNEKFNSVIINYEKEEGFIYRAFIWNGDFNPLASALDL